MSKPLLPRAPLIITRLLSSALCAPTLPRLSPSPGCEVFTTDFAVAGTCSENMYGMCESLYRPDLEPEDLFEVVSQALLSAVDRDAMSGWGAVVHVITPEGVTTRKLKARMD